MQVHLTLPCKVNWSHYRTIAYCCFNLRKSYVDKHLNTSFWIESPTKTRHIDYASESPKLCIVIPVSFIFLTELSFLLHFIWASSEWTIWKQYLAKELHFKFSHCIELSSRSSYFVVLWTPILSGQVDYALVWDIPDRVAKSSNLCSNFQLYSLFLTGNVRTRGCISGLSVSLSFLVHPVILSMLCFMRISIRSYLADLTWYEYISSIHRRSKYATTRRRRVGKHQSKVRSHQ